MMIADFYVLLLNGTNVKDFFSTRWYITHTAQRHQFTVRTIRPVNWNPRLYDLTPMDYFLWTNVKLIVNADKPQTLDQLEVDIRRYTTIVA